MIGAVFDLEVGGGGWIAKSRSQADYGAAMIGIITTALAVNIDAYIHDTIGTGYLSLIYLSLIQVTAPP